MFNSTFYLLVRLRFCKAPKVRMLMIRTFFYPCKVAILQGPKGSRKIISLRFYKAPKVRPRIVENVTTLVRLRF